MTWTRFGYICRRALLDVEKGAPVEQSLARAEAEEGSQLYGKHPSSGSVPRTLLERMGTSLSREDAISALRVYGQLGMMDQLGEPLQFKRLIAYLFLVVLVFHGVGAVYLLKVVPNFVSVLTEFEGALPGRLEFFQEYWATQTGILSALLILCMLSVQQVRQLFRFRNEAGKGLSGMLLGPEVRRSYARVNRVLSFPVEGAVSDSMDAVTAHMERARSAGMDMHTEVRELLQLEARELLRRSERQLKIMAGAVAVVVIFAMTLFLTSAYAPIFIMGEVI